MLASRAPSFGEPIKITGRDDPWEPVRTDLRDRGVALLFARLADWRPDQAGRPRLRALLGRDWARYLDLTHPDIRQRFAASRVLLKFAAAAALDVPADNVELSYGPSGRRTPVEPPPRPASRPKPNSVKRNSMPCPIALLYASLSVHSRTNAGSRPASGSASTSSSSCEVHRCDARPAP